MRTIGVISDTHGLLLPHALKALEGSDLILHAGDVGDPSILEALGKIAPTFAVFGNTDYGDLRESLPHSQVIDLAAGVPAEADRPSEDPGRVLAYMLHIEEELDLDPKVAGMRMVVYGHTHEPLIEDRDGVLWLNPGSAGPRRFNLPVTVARVRLGESADAGGPPTLSAEIIDLGL